MLTRMLPSIAVIADAHFHDASADFGFRGIEIDGERITMRSWSDTRESTRVFNESAEALQAALEEVRQRGIRHVVLLGDYTDDGQRATTETLKDILERHRDAHGTAFYALPGNHDIFGPRGRHQTKAFLGENGRCLTVSSDARRAGDHVVISDRMYCEGYPAGLGPTAAFGYFRQPDYLHWETPFGLSDAPQDRLYEVRSPDGRNAYSLMDASYLVEPEPGLWLMMIDANIFEPRDGTFEAGEEAAFIDSTAGGWNALLRCKPFIIDWIADVRRRAEALGKTLLGFSHYPVLDPFDGGSSLESALFGKTTAVQRMPRKAVEDALIDAGLAVHFSGHLHVEGVTRRGEGERSLTNIAVPSLVAFPPAFKVVHPSRQQIVVETVEMADLPVNGRICRGYVQETALAGEAEDAAFAARNYGAFLRDHQRALIRHRYFPREWPAEIVAAIADRTVREVVGLLDEKSIASGDAEMPMLELITDWYCLRQGVGLALPHVAPQRLALYRMLAERFGRRADGHASLEGFLEIFFGALGQFLDRAEDSPQRLELRLAPQPAFVLV